MRQLILMFAFVFCGTVLGNQGPGSSAQGKLMIQNRILAKVNGQPISALDVARKLDYVFVEQYPDYAKVEEARFQFYTLHWKQALNDLIEEKLILADSADKNIQISNGDIREEMENRFGPNMMARLDELGLTYEDAREAVKTDLIVGQMTAWRVNSKAVAKVGPKEIRKEYERFAEEKQRVNEWKYQVITFRGEQAESAEGIAQKVYELLSVDGYSVEELKKKMKDEWEEEEISMVSISEEFVRGEKDISPVHKEVIQGLESGMVSPPTVQSSRQGDVLRIYCLNGTNQEEVPPLDQVEMMLQGRLLQRAAIEETQEYYEMLKKQFHFDASLMSDEPPFELLVS